MTRRSEMLEGTASIRQADMSLDTILADQRSDKKARALVSRCVIKSDLVTAGSKRFRPRPRAARRPVA
ncbi:hypothetical protein ACRBEV_25670 [Methylobacterium phyllosphaerae]